MRNVALCACLAAGSFAAAWGIALVFPSAFAELNGHASDQMQILRYRLKGRGEVSPRLLHVVVTDRVRQELRLDGWDRRTFGRALQVLERMDARTIVCDVFFKDASFSDNDAPLVAAARATGQVVLPVFLLPRSPSAGPEAESAAEPSAGDRAILQRSRLPAAIEREGNAPTAEVLVPPFSELAAAAATLGHINLAPDPDGVNRRVPLLYRHRGALIPSLSLAAALHFLQVDPREVRVSFGNRILLRGACFPGGPRTDIAIPIDQTGRLIVDPVGPWEDSFVTIPVTALLAADTDPAARSRLHDVVEDALVVVSDVSTMNRDYGPGVFESVYPLSGLHVSVLNSILTSRFLAPQGTLPVLAAVLLLAAALCAASVRLRGPTFLLGCVVLYAAFLGASYGSFAGLRKVPEIAIPTAGFFLAVAALTVYRVILTERARSAAEVKVESSRELEKLNADLLRQRQALETANGRLREMERAREKAAQGVARELRAPVSALLRSLESISAGHRGDLTATLIEDMENMRREAGRLIDLVDQLVGNGGSESPAAPGSRAGNADRSPFSSQDDPVLLVGTGTEAITRCSADLQKEGIDTVNERRDPAGVLPLLRQRPCCAVVLDYDPGRLAAGLIAGIRDEFPSLRIIVLADPGNIPHAVECIRQGASDYLVKPVEPGLMVSALRLCLERRSLEKQVRDLSHRLHAMEVKNPAAFSQIVTASPRMLARFRYIEAVAADSGPVLITGESGVGKELVAGAIHRLSGRPGRYVRENIAGLDDAMFTDTLFGHLKGAFTDAREARRGLVEEAARGTLFLDEIADMPISSQVKLLRLIEGGEYRPLGSDAARTSDARIVVATNADLARRMKDGTFREDLYYRLSHRVDIPPLRERPEDLPLLLEHFAAENAQARGRGKPSIPNALIDLLRAYSFPGNVRELRNMVDAAISRSTGDTLPLEPFQEYLRAAAGRGSVGPDSKETAAGLAIAGDIPTLKETEGLIISEMLRRVGGNQSLAARLLGMSPSALSRRLRKGGPRT